MKAFFQSLKGKIITASVSVGVVAAVTAILIIANSGIRSIVVNALNGVTTVVNGSNTNEAYEGLKLKAGDDVTVSSDADLTLAMDEDKYVYAEPNTHFWIEAKGKLGNTNTKVFMDEGSNLFRIDDKLGENESFTVDTPNSTMAVRGTVFRVTCRTDENGEFYTDVEVYEGEVFVQAKFKDDRKANDNRVFKAGEWVTVHLDKDETVSEFLKSDNDYKMTEENYKNLRVGTVEFLGAAAEGGRKLCISKELLYDYAELVPHEWVEKVLKEPTETEDGEMIEVCAVCGKENGSSKKIEKTGPAVDEETDADSLETEEVLEETEEADTVNPETCNHVYGTARVTLEPTMFTEGSQVVTCTLCGTSKTETVNKLDIPLELMELAGEQTEALQQAECDHDYQTVSKGDGYKKIKCSKCGKSETIKTEKSHSSSDSGCSHNWVWVWDSYSRPNCFHHQMCTLCGATGASGSMDVTTGQSSTCSVCGHVNK